MSRAFDVRPPNRHSMQRTCACLGHQGTHKPANSMSLLLWSLQGKGLHTRSDVSCEMICSGEGPLARAALEKPLRFRIRYSANGVVLRCHVCLHCSTLTIRASGERGGGESGETLDCGGREAKSKRHGDRVSRVRPRPRETPDSPPHRDLFGGTHHHLPMKMRPSTELSCRKYTRGRIHSDRQSCWHPQLLFRASH